MNDFDIDKLSVPAKMEALRVGHSLLAIHDELLEVLKECGDYILEHEVFLVRPLGDVGAGQRVYSVKVVPTIIAKG